MMISRGLTGTQKELFPKRKKGHDSSRLRPPPLWADHQFTIDYGLARPIIFALSVIRPAGATFTYPINYFPICALFYAAKAIPTPICIDLAKGRTGACELRAGSPLNFGLQGGYAVPRHPARSF